MTKHAWTGIVFLGLLVVAGMAAQVVPVAVSPGSDRGVAVVGQACPTFSWTAVDWASSYRVAVFEALGVQIPSYEEMATGMVPALSKEIAGRALSWTPSAEEQLSAGSLYIWYVQAADSSGQGSWSKGKLFIVEAGIGASAVEGNLRKTLEEKGVREDVITDVLKETKVEGQSVLSGKTDSRPQGKVGPLGSEGPENTFYGLGAGASITSGLYDTFIGRYAGTSNTTGYYNTFLGGLAGYSNLTANWNTFIGYATGYANTTGHDNIFLGPFSGRYNTGGNFNTFLGSQAGCYNTFGDHNTFIGFLAGQDNTTGEYNTFLGSSAGDANTDGNDNNFFGYNAGHSNTTGSANAFIGYQAGYSNTTGYSNNFLGLGAGRANTTGNFNTYIGHQAGYYNSGGGYNVFLGTSAGAYETGSNKLYIANSSTSTPLVYGDFSTGILAVNGLLGIGTKSPNFPIELRTTGRNAVFVMQRSDGGAMQFFQAASDYGQFGTGNGYPVRILVNSLWRMSLNLDDSLTMSNGASCTAGGVWTNASSRELKENIEDLSAAEAEEALRGLVPVKYNYKADAEERHVGFIAEDVPELVASKDRKTMSPMNVVGVLTKVVQEQQKTLSEYRKSLAEQQKTISELKDKVSKLERKGTRDK